jgi:single-strand DNA-binding protein
VQSTIVVNNATAAKRPEDSMNTSCLIGNLTRDPELRKATTDRDVCSMRIAVDRPGSDNDPHYFMIIAWDRLALTCAEYLRKGREIAVQAYANYRQWQLPDGSKTSAVEFVAHSIDFIGPATKELHQAPAPNDEDAPPARALAAVDPEDEIPF